MDRINGPRGNFPAQDGSNLDGGIFDGIGDALDRLNAKETGTLPNATTGHWEAIGINPNTPNHGVFGGDTHGYGVDINHNGQYDAGQDAVLGMDFNHDGKIDNTEVERTNNLMSAWGGDNDFNHDGKVDTKEQFRGAILNLQEGQYDTNHDGKLSNDELKASGTQAWVDKNKDGQINEGETSSIDKIKSGSKLFPNDSKIFEVDPGKHTAEVRTKNPLDNLHNQLVEKAKQHHPVIVGDKVEPKPPVADLKGHIDVKSHIDGKR